MPGASHGLFERPHPNTQSSALYMQVLMWPLFIHLHRRADRMTTPLKLVGLLMIAWPLVFGFMITLRVYDWLVDCQQKAMGIIDALSDDREPKDAGVPRNPKSPVKAA